MARIRDSRLPPSLLYPDGRRAWPLDKKSWDLLQRQEFYGALRSNRLEVRWTRDLPQADEGREAADSEQNAEAEGDATVVEA